MHVIIHINLLIHIVLLIRLFEDEIRSTNPLISNFDLETKFDEEFAQWFKEYVSFFIFLFYRL